MIVYDIIGEPPLVGAAQVTTTLVLETTDVAGAVGVLGLAAARIANSEEKALLPTKLRDRILNV